MFEWEEGDRYSFEDSDRFEEDSLCSWMSEPESVCSNWRGWKKAYNYSNQSYVSTMKHSKDGQVLSLVELAAKQVACHIPFEAVEHFYPPVPEQLQLRIAFWSFPENEEDIRLYSCLANGSAEEFQKGEGLLKGKAVKDLLQIGFHLSATVINSSHVGSSKGCFNVAVTFDRRRITSCNCTCLSRASWCAHVVAVCLYRIHQPTQVCLRAPVSESLSRLHRDQLQKFAQYLISELPQQILPTAQRLLDDLLSSQQTKINTLSGAPDPTAGASVNEQTTWCLDESQIHENIRKILIKLCVPSPMVFSDVNYLSYTAHPAAAEWSSLLRPLRGREPEGMWNLLSIVREMFRRGDRNAIPLLKILTEEVLACDQIVLWWFNTKVTLHAGGNGHNNRNNLQGNTHASQHACSSLCDEIVVLWRLACLNPGLSTHDRQDFSKQLHDWHIKTLERVFKMRTSSTNSSSSNPINNVSGAGNRRVDFEVFPGFKPAMEACSIDWDDYPVTGVAYVEGLSKGWYNTNYSNQSFMSKDIANVTTGVVVTFSNRRSGKVTHASDDRCGLNSVFSTAVTSVDNEHTNSLATDTKDNAGSENEQAAESNRSSFSSEGFCESSETEHLDSDTAVLAKSAVAVGTDCAQKVDSKQNLLCRLAEKLSVAEKIAEVTENVDAVTRNDNPVNLAEENSCQPSASSGIDIDAQKVDEYNVYRYDANSVAQNPSETIKASSSRKACAISNASEDQFVVIVKKVDDPLEILFARAEALHAHGLTKEACQLAVQLAEEMLVNPPNLMTELPTPPIRGKRGRRFNPTCHQISLLASTTLSKAAFLCSVLSEIIEHHHLAFKVGLFGLEIARPPASTKSLEVKLANQEQELVTLLKKIPLTTMQLQILREKAEQLRDGKLKSRGEALLPLMLASYIFDSLVLSANQQTRSGPPISGRLPSDELLGFEAAVAALGLKANVSEAEHPLLCEGTRRQRGELAITLLVYYKDDKEKLARIMDKLLDKDVHQMYKNLPTSSSPSSFPSPADATSSEIALTENVEVTGAVCSSSSSKASSGSNSDESDTKDQGIDVTASNSEDTTSSSTFANRVLSSKRQNERRPSEVDRSEGALSPCWDEDYKAWEARFRCTNLRTAKKHSVGMASIDSSAPETTSSDNSPTVVRRPLWIRPGGPGSDSGSSGESSDSFASSSSGDKTKKSVEPLSPQTLLKQNCSTAESSNGTPVNRSSLGSHSSQSPIVNATVINVAQPPPNPSVSTPTSSVVTTVASLQNITKAARFKGKRANPSIPNQPSQASSHFMFELAKTVLTKAGGNSSSGVLFTQPTSNQNHRLPHRALHMCAFQIGLYALGLHNAVTPNWLSRTYSSHVSWITGQAAEIGAPAINFLIDTWEGHLTPPEVASLADRASRGRDRNMVKAAAKLALSCLPHASALNPNEIQRALIQCREQSNDVLEQACLAIETAAKGGGVYPEVLFEVARNWYQLYEESLPKSSNRTGQGSSQNNRNENPTPYVQASIGEFQVPTSTNSMSNSAYGILTENSPHLLPGSERQMQNDVLLSVNQSAHSSNAVGPFGNITQASAQLPLQVLPQSHFNLPPHPTTAVPYRFYSGIPPFPSAHPLQLHPAYIQSPSPFPYQYFPSATTTAAAAAAAVAAAASLPHLRNPIFPTQPMMPNIVMAQGPAVTQSPRLQMIPVTGTANPHQIMIPVCGGPGAELHHYQLHHLANQVQQPHQRLNQRQLGYLLSAYRVGMLAMDILARRVHDDRPQAKYARNPSYGEDVKWLLGIAKKLGTSYLQDFCICTVNSVASPFILFDIILEAAAYLSQPGSTAQPFRSPIITPLIQKCQQMFIACTHFKMYHISPADYEEFVSIVRSARQAFQLTPGGMVQFNELLQSLRRSKSYKKELWQHLTTALQQNANI